MVETFLPIKIKQLQQQQQKFKFWQKILELTCLTLHWKVKKITETLPGGEKNSISTYGNANH